jgi:putative ABC transport system ATP-binding protein
MDHNVNKPDGVAVQIAGVTKSFGTSSLVLAGVDGEIAYGGVTMLVGPSGCGKTTLLSVIAGLCRPTSGRLRVLGHDPYAHPDWLTFRRDNLGLVFQHYHLLASLTATENAAVSLIAKGVPRSSALATARELLVELGLQERLDHLPGQLSGGQQQRVAVARALAHNPRLVLCDEPTAALDAGNGRAVMEMIVRTAARPDRAVVIVTHDSRIYRFADRVIEMEDGVVTGQRHQTASAVEHSHV